MSVSVLQSIGGDVSGANELDLTFAGTNTAHKQIFVIAGVKGSSDTINLTCEDTLTNFYEGDGGAGPIISGSHSKFRLFRVNNGRPGASPGDCTIKIKTVGGVNADIVAVAIELNGGSGKIVGIPVATPQLENGALTDTSGLTPIAESAGDWYLFAVGYGEPNNASPSAVTTGAFSLSMTPLKVHASAIGTIGIFAEELDGWVNGALMGAIYTFDSSPTTSASGGYLAGVIATATSPDFQAPAPLIGPNGGEFNHTQTATLSCALPGMDLYYTLDGSTPDATKTLYSVPFNVPGPTTTVKAIAIDPTGFWTDSFVSSAVFDFFTATITNPANIIDGDDNSFCEIDADGAAGDVGKVRIHDLGSSITGAAGSLKVIYEVTQNDLVDPSQTLDAVIVTGKIGGTETVLANHAKGAGAIAKNTVSLTVPIGTHVGTLLSASVAAICQNGGATGGVKVKIYAAFLDLP